MTEKYKDFFRETLVKKGSQHKADKPCPKCNHFALQKIEILRLVGDNRFAGFDYHCFDCCYKWKEMEEIGHAGVWIKRPGIYIRNNMPDAKYTSKIVAELISLFNTRLDTDLANTDEVVDYETTRELATSEFEVDENIFVTRMFEASQNGDINEGVFDHVWITNWHSIEGMKTASIPLGAYLHFSNRRFARNQVIYNYLKILDAWKTGNNE